MNAFAAVSCFLAIGPAIYQPLNRSPPSYYFRSYTSVQLEFGQRLSLFLNFLYASVWPNGAALLLLRILHWPSLFILLKFWHMRIGAGRSRVHVSFHPFLLIYIARVHLFFLFTHPIVFIFLGPSRCTFLALFGGASRRFPGMALDRVGLVSIVGWVFLGLALGQSNSRRPQKHGSCQDQRGCR